MPTVAAIVAAVLGVVNLLSALTPNAHWRGHLLLEVEPIEATHVFHALAVPASVALLVGAFYLRRRRRVAWQVALALLCGLTLLDIVKGLDVEEAALTAAGAALLWWGRDAFVVRGDPVRLRSALWRVPAIAIGDDPPRSCHRCVRRAARRLLGVVQRDLRAPHLAAG